MKNSYQHKGITLIIMIAIAIATGAIGFFIGVNTVNAEKAISGSTVSQESNFLGIDKDGFYVFRKQATWSASSIPASGIIDENEISLNEIIYMYAHLGTVTLKIPSPGSYVFYYSITPPDPDDNYVNLKYLQVIIMKPDAIKPDGTIDRSKILAWEIYKYNKVVKVQFYADMPGIYLAIFGPAEGSIVTMKAYQQQIPIHNLLRLKVVSSVDPNVKGEILSAEALDVIVTKINDFIAIEKVVHQHQH